MQAYNAAFDAGNVDGMADLLTDDFKMVMHSSGKVTNKVEWKKQWAGFIGRNYNHVAVRARRAATCTCLHLANIDGVQPCCAHFLKEYALTSASVQCCCVMVQA